MQHEFLAHHDVVRVAAEGHAADVHLFAVLHADETVLAVLFQPFETDAAALAGVHQSTDTGQIARLELRDRVADGSHAADDLVAGHDRMTRIAPLVTHGMQIGMANAAVQNIDPHIVGPQIAPLEIQLVVRHTPIFSLCRRLASDGVRQLSGWGARPHLRWPQTWRGNGEDWQRAKPRETARNRNARRARTCSA